MSLVCMFVFSNVTTVVLMYILQVSRYHSETVLPDFESNHYRLPSPAFDSSRSPSPNLSVCCAFTQLTALKTFFRLIHTSSAGSQFYSTSVDTKNSLVHLISRSIAARGHSDIPPSNLRLSGLLSRAIPVLCDAAYRD